MAFYAMGVTQATALSVTAYTVYIPLEVLAFLRYGLIAPAVTMSIYFVVSFPIQFLVLEKAVQLHLCNGREAFAGKIRTGSGVLEIEQGIDVTGRATRMML